MRARWLLIAFLLMPIIEIAVIIQVGQQIGAGWTVALLLGISIVGAWLVKREGRRAWHDLQVAVQSGQLPGRELTDAALILVGGTLLLTPGFVTDAIGFFLVVPITRPLVRRSTQAWLARRTVTYVHRGQPGTGPTQPGTGTAQPGTGTSHRRSVIPGEIVDD